VVLRTATRITSRPKRNTGKPVPNPDLPLRTPSAISGGAGSLADKAICSVQRYEGASTLYGPHTLAAYINVTLSLIPYLGASSESHPPAGPQPPDNTNRSLSFISGVVRDGSGPFKKFGDVITDVRDVYRRGTPVAAVFVGANPRNNLRLESSYAMVEQLVEEAEGNGVELVRGRRQEDKRKWRVVRDDRDWFLVFRWRRTSEILATSEVEITWETESWAEPGTYRLRYFGDSKSLGGTITPFEGISKEFRLE
jgi:neutral ceramidase